MSDADNITDIDGGSRDVKILREELETAQIFASATTPAERRRAFAILFVALVCLGAGQSVLFTILPSVSRQLGLTSLQVTSVFSVSALIWIFSSSFWGVRSNHWGRKPVMLLGLVAFAVSFACFAGVMLAGLQHWLPVYLIFWGFHVPFIFIALVLARAIYGLVGSGNSASAQAYVADRTTPHERLRGVSMVTMAFALGTTFGPVIGSELTVFGLLTPFFFVSGMALASAAAIFFLLPERTAPISHHTKKSTLRWYEPRMLPFILFGVVLSLIGSIPPQTLGLFFLDVLKQDAHTSAQSVGIGLMVASIVALFAQLVIVQLFRISARTLTIAGLIIAVFSNALFLVAHNFMHVLIALILSGLGFALARPGFTSGASLAVAPHEQGAVAGLLGAAGAAGFIFGPLIGLLYEVSPFMPYAFGAVVMLLLLAAQWLSPVLRKAGDIPPDMDIVEESTETTVPNI